MKKFRMQNYSKLVKEMYQQDISQRSLPSINKKKKKIVDRNLNQTPEMKKMYSENQIYSSNQKELNSSEFGIPSNFSTRDLIIGKA